ncbi:hypothetical protein [Rhodoflexus caldus]|uniref:hypothetical protein n=1 Tax=Rhodoflexus caldus TaxID=2891236 RepID=UPI00202A7C70|nr:hypothetical protein [Rhodoflexus caldus]
MFALEVIPPSGIASFLDLEKEVVSISRNLSPFDFDFLKGIATQPISLRASKKNARLLRHPDLPASAAPDLFRPVAARLYLNSDIIAGTFTLIKASPKVYEGVFAADVSLLAEHKDKQLADLLAALEYEMPGRTLASLNALNTGDHPVAFPEVKFANRIYNRYINGAYVVEQSQETLGLIPFFKLMYVFEEAVKAIGWTVNANWFAPFPDIGKLLLGNEREIVGATAQYSGEPFPIDYGVTFDGVPIPTIQFPALSEIELPERLRVVDYIPNMTFGELLLSLRSLAGLVIEADGKFKRINISFVERVTESTQVDDITDVCEPLPEVSPADGDSYRFSFGDEDDPLTRDQPKDASGYTIAGEVISPAEIGEAQNANDLRFVVALNRYFAALFNSDTQTLQWQSFAHANWPLIIGNGKKEVATAFSPFHADYELDFQGRNGDISVNGDTVRIIHRNTVQFRPALIFLRNSKIYPNDRPANVTADGALSLDTNLQFRGRETGIEWTRRVYYNRIIPESGRAAIAPSETEATAANPRPRILFWHGLQQGFDGTPYPYASPSNYTATGQKLAEFAIRWENTEGLAETFYRNALKILESGRKVEIRAKLAANRILAWRIGQKVKIRENVFFVLDAEFEASKNGVNIVRLTLLKAFAPVLPPVCERVVAIEEWIDCRPADGIIPPRDNAPVFPAAGKLPLAVTFEADCDTTELTVSLFDCPDDEPPPDVPGRENLTVQFFADCAQQANLTVNFLADCVPVYTITIMQV